MHHTHSHAPHHVHQVNVPPPSMHPPTHPQVNMNVGQHHISNINVNVPPPIRQQQHSNMQQRDQNR